MAMSQSCMISISCLNSQQNKLIVKYFQMPKMLRKKTNMKLLLVNISNPIHFQIIGHISKECKKLQKKSYILIKCYNQFFFTSASPFCELVLSRDESERRLSGGGPPAGPLTTTESSDDPLLLRRLLRLAVPGWLDWDLIMTKN